MKKVLAGALFAMMMCALATPVFAGPPEGDGLVASGETETAPTAPGSGIILYGPPEGDG